MTGDRPDVRLRTPMQWTGGPGAGFTSGTPWEPLQPDSARANVARQSDDPTSLLNHYRRLIRLRRSEPALGSGAWVPLDAGSDAIAAYLRRTDADTLLVAVNLGGVPTEARSLAGPPGSLPAGAFRVEPLDGTPVDGLETGPHRVSGDGRTGPVLPPLPPYGLVLLRVRPGVG